MQSGSSRIWTRVVESTSCDDNNYTTLFNDASIILIEEKESYYLTHCWGDKRVHTFPKGIGPKVNVIMRAEFELAYFEVTVKHFSH